LGTEEYRFLEHMTDQEIEAFGETLDEAFAHAGKALEDTMVDIETITPGFQDNIEVDGRDKEDLLYRWLESLIVKQDTEGMLYSKFDCKISRNKDGLGLRATLHGEKFDPKKHEEKTSIKAPTFHQMRIDDSSIPVTIHFILDL
jgi:SHS2 domain-containing protein